MEATVQKEIGNRGTPLRWVIPLMLLMLLPPGAWARPTTPDQAQQVVRNWLLLDWKPLGAPLGQKIARVETFRDDAGSPLYHVVHLDPAGLVLVAGDDLVEPVVGFLSRGHFDPSEASCLGALVNRDIPGRVREARRIEALATARGLEFTPEGIYREARSKWEVLETGSQAAHMDQVSDVRVPPLTQSKWGQGDEGTARCYNYYTPNHYVCGCGATALAQVMRYHKHPTVGIGVKTFKIFVDTVMQDASTRGGNGSGGPYDWANMVLDPTPATTDLQRRAIGALCYDAGVAHNMHYNDPPGQSTSILGGKYPLVDTFKYGNTRFGWNPDKNIPSANLNAMINPNLDAALPVILGASGPVGSHFFLCDGYGYHVTTLYHHLNLGWDGGQNVWYNLPNIDSAPSFNLLDECWYNIYKSGTGEILSGRVLTPEGYPITGAMVKATGGGKTYQATTNGRGIYALSRLPENTAFTVETSGMGTTASVSAATGKSQNGGITTGNKWGVNLTLQPTGTRLNSEWEHGSKIRPEAPWLLASTARRGWGSIFRGLENTSNWFHIPITTPVIKESQRTVVVKAFVFFQTLGNAKITAVHVWDGARKIRAFEGLSLGGSHMAWDRWNNFPLWETMQTGLEIAVQVEFGPKSGDGIHAGIHFTSAGADFYRWW